MASLDFVYDIVDKLNEDGVDYLIIAIQHQHEGKEESRADIFYNMSDDQTPGTLIETLEKFDSEVLSKYDTDFDDSDDDEPELE
jgi:hypothetical protein